MHITRTALCIGNFELRWYGMLIALGVLAALICGAKREEKLGLKKDTAINVVLLCVPIGIVCARLYYVIFNWPLYAGSPLSVFDIRQGGLAIYGGVIGGVFTGWIYARITKSPFPVMADMAAPGIALAQAIGRWGNFLNGEAYGRAAEKLTFFPVSVYIEGSGWHLATFFYESMWCFLTAFLLLFAEKHGVFKKRGDTFLGYVLLYALERSVVEGLRTDSLMLGSMRVSQLLSLIAALAVCVLLFMRVKNTGGPKAALAVLCVIAEGAMIACGSELWPLIPALGAAVIAILLYTASKSV